MRRLSLRHTTYISLFAAVTFLVTVLAFSACSGRNRIAQQPLREVVVLHSWDSVGEEGQFFTDVMEDAFKEEGINARIHHYYLNMIHKPPHYYSIYDWPILLDSIRANKPDIILLNDDPIMEAIVEGYFVDSIFDTIPMVFAGVNVLPEGYQERFPLMTGYEDRIDLVKNLEMIQAIRPEKAVTIELDHKPVDSLLRERFKATLADTTKYINNEDFHLERTRPDLTNELYPKKTVVHFISAARPYTNKHASQSDSVGKAALQRVYKNAKFMPQLQVKYDIYSNSIIDRSQRPQFTCIREQFNSKRRTRFLAGYFTSTRTQVTDEVKLAARILKGESPRSMGRFQHHPDYYMNWNAMQLCSPPLRYSEYANGKNGYKFNIVNAPEELAHPLELTMIVIGIAVLILLVCNYIVRYLLNWRNEGQRSLVKRLMYEEEIHGLIFKSTNDTVWQLKDDMFMVEQYFAKNLNISSNIFPLEYVENNLIHPDSKSAFMMLKNFHDLRGKKQLRMRITFDKGKTWTWIEVAFVVTEESVDKNELYGILLNIDERKAMEEKLEQAQILSSEVELKENFLANISHDLRTPLGAVTGFSELLAMPELELGEEERAEYSNYIHQNTDMILSMIDDVMHKAQTNDSSLEILCKPVEMSKLINECFQTNSIIVPSNLDFSLQTVEPDCEVNIDLIRIKQVINNFLSNAFKFTSLGSVTLGWRYISGKEVNDDVIDAIEVEPTDGEDDKNWVEIYVEDTGIGIAPENITPMFTRFTKVAETDRGTGLGLNISKTIVEKHNGVIGVQSELHKGSKFFFRLRRFAQCLLLVLSLAATGLFTTSCVNMWRPKTNANILVVHSYDSLYYAYPKFNEELRYTLVKNGINPTIKHVYLDLENPRLDHHKEYDIRKKALKDGGFDADILLSDGDRVASFLLDIPRSTVSDKSQSMPIVLGAMHHPEWERIRKTPNMIAISDPIDYVTNINLAVRLTNTNAVIIELDYSKQDSLTRIELREAIKRPPFIDNTDFHLPRVNHNIIDSISDSIFVLSYSIDFPERNKFPGSPDIADNGFLRLETMLVNAWHYPALAVKKDVYSTEIVDKTGRPQFTAVKAGFADGEARYLCGYFANYSTIAKDMATITAKILKGIPMSELRGATHEKKYYMDYEAMKILGLEYSDYKDKFEIVGAPTSVTSPFLHYLLIGVVILVLLLGCSAAFLIILSWREREKDAIMKDLQRRATIRHMALNEADCRNVQSEETVMEIIDSVHPDYAAEVPLMRQSVDVAGSHSYVLYADIDKNGEYHWWQLRYGVIFDKRGKTVYGILFNIDKDKQREQDLKLAVKLAEEAKQKEDFLTTISHELRTPLNAVVGFSDVMVTLPREQITNEEMVKYGKIIKANNNVLKGMIEDILMFSRIESRRMKYVNKEFEVKGLIDELVEEWQPLMPENLTLHAFCIEQGIVMNNDRQRLKYILNQMLSNAVKFTKQGTILLGVMFHYNDDTVEFVVGDTGCGISQEKLNTMFGLFWKDNEFIPGLGLGLHVAYKLAEGMNLKIEVESKEGYGTKMLVKGKGALRFSEEKQGIEAKQNDSFYPPPVISQGIDNV